MNRTIYCTFLKRSAAGLDYQTYPGEVGQRIYHTISKTAWTEWQKKQTMLINENKLSMLRVSDRKLLEQKMIDFLFNHQDIHIQGYSSPSK